MDIILIFHNNNYIKYIYITKKHFNFSFSFFQMDKASIVKDAIEYIVKLQKQDRRIRGEISKLESETSNKNSTHLQHETFDFSNPKTLDEHQYGYHSSPIDVLQVIKQYLHITLFSTHFYWPEYTNISFKVIFVPFNFERIQLNI